MSLLSVRGRAVTSLIHAGQLGLKTAIVEKDKELGGTCLNVGCIPSKALLTSSDHFMFVKKEAAKHGIMIDGADVDLAKMQQRCTLMKTNKVTTFEGLGTITAPENSQADHETQITANSSHLLKFL